MELAILGPLEVRDRYDPIEIPGARERTLLALLATRLGRVVPADRLVEELWGDDLPLEPANALQAVVSRLRKALGDGKGVVVTRAPGYLLDVDPVCVDANAFEHLAADARRRMGQDPAGAASRFEQALALWRGPALPELVDTEIGRQESARLEELRLAAEEDHIEVLVALGRYAEALGHVETLIRDHPLRERLWRQRMLALYRSGRQAEALRAYQDARRVLVDELGIEPSTALRKLEQQILAQSPELDGPRKALRAAGPVPGGNLPARPTSFVGRDKERREVGKLIAENRLVTLTGPGGVGKTSLAVEVARDRADDTEGGVWLVRLGSVTDPRLVVAAVAATLGVREQPEGGVSTTPLLDRLVELVVATEPLVVLDNCEHLVDACAALVATLLEASAGVSVLATSREPLAVAGEVLWPVPPLAVPQATERPEDLLTFESVRLFVDRATASSPAFTLDATTGAAVAEICQRLDGIPLALELAAARTRTLPVDEIAGRLDDRFRLLAVGRRDAEPRQQTLRAALDWSHDLLSDRERVLLRRLGAFAGSWTLATAEAVTSGDGLDRRDVVDVHSALVDRSLVVPAQSGRFHLLETVREYARGRLAEAR